MSDALLELRGAKRRYASGGQEIYALRGIDLNIHAGEMVALMGASGSGKSTLMNVLGCLDRLSEGSYRVAGQDASTLGQDQLALLRRRHFGFVFQRYNLLSQLSAVANVEIPAIYAGKDASARDARARALLMRLKLSARADHRPHQLSGGQQQRVSIARALMNGGEIILADEPTGALDSQTGREVMELLLELNRRGHTLVIATHDRAVASFAHRIIEVADGVLVSDAPVAPGSGDLPPGAEKQTAPPDVSTRGGAEGCARAVGVDSDVFSGGAGIEAPGAEDIDAAPSASVSAVCARIGESAHMAVVALLAHRLRTALTLLGVVIGIVSVVIMVALGEAAQRYVAAELKGLATNSLEILPGSDWGDVIAAKTQTLTVRDVDALRDLGFVESVSPQLTQSMLLRYREIQATGSVNGVAVEYFRMSQLPIDTGGGFTPIDVERQAQVVVIDKKVRKLFFKNSNPIGQTLYVGRLPCIVIGVTGTNYQQETRDGAHLKIWLPYTTVAARLLGRAYFDTITVSLQDGIEALSAETKLTRFLEHRHRTKDFMIFNLADRIKTSVDLQKSITLLLGAIGLISLTVGGIGVMNIMLVSVTERAREIGVRIAVGARQSDIRRQFLIEAVLVCLIGAAIGVTLSYILCKIGAYFLPPAWEIWLSLPAVGAAVLSATLTGVLFGYAPAQNAARLDPVEALARD